MLSIIRFLKGYLIIKFSGENGEKLLNIFADNNLNTWNMVYSNGFITGCIDIKSFLKLRPLLRGKHIRIKVVSKRGLKIVLNKNKKRGGLFLGAIIFLIILKILSIHIWTIDVYGNERISKAEIIKLCSIVGIKEGILSKNIDTKNDALKLLLLNKDISWVALNIEGSKLTVNITEVSENNKTEHLPSNIKASKDGIITEINASSGDVQKKIGDTVHEGDIIISGVISNASSTVFLKSSGTVYAKTNRTYQKYKPYKEEINYTESKTKSKKILFIFGLKIPLYIGKIGDVKILSYNRNNLTLYGEKLPLGIISIKYKNVKKKQINNTKEEIELLLNNQIDKEINNEKLKVLRIINSNTKEDTNGVYLFREIECIEEIGKEEKILINTVN